MSEPTVVDWPHPVRPAGPAVGRGLGRGFGIRPRALRRRLALAGLAGMVVAATATAAVARADGMLSSAEVEYVAAHGQFVVCQTLDGYASPATVVIAMQAVMADGLAPDDAVDVVNASVLTYCPDHWPLLQRAGAMAREGAVLV